METVKDSTLFYNLLNYREVYIVFKQSKTFGEWNTFVHFDKVKQRYFYKGRIIKFDLTNWNGAIVKSFPEEGKLSILEESCVLEWEQTKNQSEKANLIINVLVDDVDYILLPIMTDQKRAD